MQTNKNKSDISRKAFAALLLFAAGFALLSNKNQDDWVPAGKEETSKQLIDINKRILKLKKYTFEVTYKTYKGHYTREVFEENKGYVIKDGLNYRSYIMGKRIVQNKVLRVIIDSAAKIMKVNNPKEELEPDFNLENTVKVMDAFKQVKVMQSEGLNAYRFEMKSTRGIVAEEFFFDQDFIKQLVIYYANLHTLRQNDETKEEVVYPRLSIEFDKFQVPGKLAEHTFDTSPYVTVRKGVLQAGPAYKNYKLIDGRYTK